MRARWDDRLVVVLAVVAGCLGVVSPAEAHPTSTHLNHTWNWTTAPINWLWTPSVPASWRSTIAIGAQAWGDIGRNMYFANAGEHPVDFDPAPILCNLNQPNTVHVTSNTTFADTIFCTEPGDSTRMKWFAIRFAPAKTPAYPAGVDWNTGTGPTPLHWADLAGVAAHEFGHGMGLAHFEYTTEPLTCPSTLSYPTMCNNRQPGTEFPGEYQRTPEPHDIHTFAAAYSGSNSVCGFVVYGAIKTAYDSLGGQGGVDGCPTTEQYDVDKQGRRQDMTSGSYVWHPETGARQIRGAIRDRWNGLGGPTWGYPTLNDVHTADGIGYYGHFREIGGVSTCGLNSGRSIFWRSETGAHPVQGGIRAKYCQLGWEGGVGYPVDQERQTLDGIGYYQHFRRFAEGNNCGTAANHSIFWRPETGAHEVRGGIRARWCNLSWERGVMGYPFTDELATSGGTGFYNHFAKYNGTTYQYSGSIFWSASTGAWEVYGPIWSTWSGLSFERGVLGFPIATRETQVAGGPSGAGTTGSRQRFQGGHIYLTQTYGANAVYGPILSRFLADGGTPAYGFPKNSVYTPAGGAAGDQQVDFQNATIRYKAATGTTQICQTPTCSP